MRKFLKNFLFVFIGFSIVGYLIYLPIYGYCLQRNIYSRNVEAHIDAVCRTYLRENFNQYLSETDQDYTYRTDSYFMLNNDLYFLHRHNFVLIYFPNMAPQPVSCTGHVEAGDAKTINEDSIVTFRIYGPRYIPIDFNKKWDVQDNSKLTLREIKDNHDFSVFAIRVGKPGFLEHY